MKRKHILTVLLILIAVLAIAGVAASVYLSYYLPWVMDAQEKRINIVRYIGLCQTDAFYDEIMSLPDGYIRLSDLKTPLAKASGERPKNRELLNGEFLVLSVSSGINGSGQLRPSSEFIYIKKEGRFLCVAATTFPPERYLLKPWLGWKAMRFEWIPDEGDPHGLEEERRKLVKAGVLPEDGKVVWTEDWDIDPYELFKHGILFYPPDEKVLRPAVPASELQARPQDVIQSR